MKFFAQQTSSLPKSSGVLLGIFLAIWPLLCNFRNPLSAGPNSALSKSYLARKIEEGTSVFSDYWDPFKTNSEFCAFEQSAGPSQQLNYSDQWVTICVYFSMLSRISHVPKWELDNCSSYFCVLTTISVELTSSVAFSTIWNQWFPAFYNFAKRKFVARKISKRPMAIDSWSCVVSAAECSPKWLQSNIYDITKYVTMYS